MRYSRWKQRLRRETKGLPLEQGLSLRRWPLSRAPSRPGSEPRGRLGERAPGGANKREGAEAPTPAGLGISREAAVRKYPGAGDAGQRKGRQEATSQRAWGHSSNRGLYPGKTRSSQRRRCHAAMRWLLGIAEQEPSQASPSAQTDGGLGHGGRGGGMGDTQ